MLERILERYIAQYGDTNESRIASYKQYLKETDYVVIKMYEIAMQGEVIDDMLQEYEEVLLKREECRALINELEIIN